MPGGIIYGLKPDVWGRVGPDLRAELQVNTTQGPNARGLGRSSTQSFLLHRANRNSSMHSNNNSFVEHVISMTICLDGPIMVNRDKIGNKSLSSMP